jgi:hypothetical protein
MFYSSGTTCSLGEMMSELPPSIVRVFRDWGDFRLGDCFRKKSKFKRNSETDQT